jgi:hypothetical protein
MIAIMITYEIQHVVLTLPLFVAITKEQIEASLTLLNIHIWPHLRTSNETAQSFLLYGDKRTQETAADGLFVENRKACNVKAKCEFCGAAFILLQNEGGGHLLLHVRREFHDFRRPDITAVFANLEDIARVCYGETGGKGYSDY